MGVLTFAACATLARVVLAIPSATGLGTDLQILLHNDLYGKKPISVSVTWLTTFRQSKL